MSELALAKIRENQQTRSPRLNLARCGLTSLPPELFECTWLEELILSNRIWNAEKREWEEQAESGPYNLLRELPPELGQLTQLTQLYAGGSGTIVKVGLRVFEDIWDIDDISAVKELRNLQSLDLRYINVRDISVLQTLTSLLVLNLSHTKVEDISTLHALINLLALDLSHTKVKDIAVLQALNFLLELDLSDSSIQEISTLDKLNKLRTLKIRNIKIENITVLKYFTKLQSLDLYLLNAKNITILKKLPELETLNLAGRNLHNLLDLTCLKKLRSLDISNTSVFDLSGIQSLTHLEELSLRNTQVKDLNGLESLNKLKALDISKTLVDDISIICELKNLEKLNLGHTPAKNIASLKNLANLKSLLLCNTKTKDISFFQSFQKLEIADLSKNQVSNITALSKLRKLKTLNLSTNKVFDIGPLENLNSLEAVSLYKNTKVFDISSIKDLSNLQVLDLFNTSVDDISPLISTPNILALRLSDSGVVEISCIKALLDLHTLFLDNTQVSEIAVLEKLLHLQLLDLSHSQIKDISIIKSLTRLQLLSFTNTYVSEIPSLSPHQALQSLDLSKTKVESLRSILPLIRQGIPVVRTHGKASEINVQHCPLTEPPLEVVKQGNEAILEYFAERELGGEETVYEAKLLIVGEAGTGKTTLARKLCDVHAPMPEETEDTTRGIQIKIETLCEPGKPDFHMHIWDFGGQEIYHSTHQFFLTKRSLYVLLLDGRKEEDPHYWLQVQDLLGEDSPVLLLLNQKGDIQSPLSEQELRGYYGNLKDAYTINLKDDQTGTEHLQAEIAHHIRNLPHFRQGEKIPRRWVRIREQLENRGKEEPYISLQTYRDICAEIGISEKRKQDILSDFLHSLGVILHFPKEDLLRKMVILRPDWATNAVYQVLDHTKAKADPPGHFRREQLADIWQLDSHQEADAELLALMKMFELCYELPHQKDTYIVPRLLPNDQPTYEWPEDAAQLEVRYAYTFMPKGIVTRLIVRQHRYIADQTTVWQRGAVFTYQGAYAEVIERYRDRRIHLRAYGPNRRDVLTLLSKDIDELNASFDFDEKLKVEALIPCNCERCSTVQGDEKEYFDRETLLDFKASHISDIQCRKGKTMVSVLGLIGDVFTRQQIHKLSQQYEAPMAKRHSESDASPRNVININGGQVNLNADTQGDIHQTIHQTQQQFDLSQHLAMIRELVEAEKEAGLLDEDAYEEVQEVLEEVAESPTPADDKQKRRWRRGLKKVLGAGQKFFQGRLEKGLDTGIGEGVKSWVQEGGLDTLEGIVKSMM